MRNCLLRGLLLHARPTISRIPRGFRARLFFRQPLSLQRRIAPDVLAWPRGVAALTLPPEKILILSGDFGSFLTLCCPCTVTAFAAHNAAVPFFAEVQLCVAHD